MDVKLLLTMGVALCFLHHGIYQLDLMLLLLFTIKKVPNEIRGGTG